jgi:peptidoglycan-associated lipoprotein
MLRSLWTISLIGSFALVVTACGDPEYPNCENDKHCKKGEFCVNKKCQQCRNNADCGEGKQCNGGRCEGIPGWCKTKDDCEKGQICKDNKCGPCSSDAECGENGKCRNGKCLGPGECASDDDCKPGEECQNGMCAKPPKPADPGPCTPEAVYFDFNEFVLTSSATAKLRAAAKCIKSVKGKKMRLEGHCDPRGTEEYNLALGERRARSVLKYLKRLGVSQRRLRTLSKGKLEATGTDETSWSQDRKVKFVWE